MEANRHFVCSELDHRAFVHDRFGVGFLAGSKRTERWVDLCGSGEVYCHGSHLDGFGWRRWRLLCSIGGFQLDLTDRVVRAYGSVLHTCGIWKSDFDDESWIQSVLEGCDQCCSVSGYTTWSRCRDETGFTVSSRRAELSALFHSIHRTMVADWPAIHDRGAIRIAGTTCGAADYVRSSSLRASIGLLFDDIPNDSMGNVASGLRIQGQLHAELHSGQ